MDCPVCGRRLFLSDSVPGGKLYFCPKGHPTSVGTARPRIRLVLGKVSWRKRLRHRWRGI